MRITRRSAGLALPALFGRSASAGNDTINLVSGAPPGSAAARWVQGFAPFLERHFPLSSVRVVTMPGGSGLVAARTVAAGGPGTCGVVATPQLLANLLEVGASDLLDALTFVAAVVEESLVLLGHRPDAADPALRQPGAAVTLGTPPKGSAAALAATALVDRGAGFDTIAFANPAAARKAVETGSVPLALLALPDAIASIRDGRLFAIGVAGTRRATLLAETPTLAELGQPVALVGRRGLVLPRDASAGDHRRLAAALAAVVADPEFIAQANEQGYAAQLIRDPEWGAECRRLLRRIASATR